MRIRYMLVVFLIFTINSSSAQQFPKRLFTGRIVYFGKELENIIPSGAKLEQIGSGFQHIEGPVWISDSSMLLFSDTKANLIYRWSEAKGISKFLDKPGFTGRPPYSEEPGSNGLALYDEKTLLIATHGDRRIASFPINGKYGLKTVADNFEGNRLNSPNDIAVRSDGSIYFTDPSYGLPMKEADATKELAFNGVFRIKQNGTPELLTQEITLPNGLAFSPDENILYITSSDEAKPVIKSYQVDKEGKISNGKIFFDASALERMQLKQITDGLKTDRYGNLWASGPGGLLIISPAGKLLGKIETYEVISNCAWNTDRTTLFLTAGAFLYRLQLK